MTADIPYALHVPPWTEHSEQTASLTLEVAKVLFFSIVSVTRILGSVTQARTGGDAQLSYLSHKEMLARPELMTASAGQLKKKLCNGRQGTLL